MDNQDLSPNADNLFKVLLHVLESFHNAGGSGDDVVQVIGQLHEILLVSRSFIAAANEREGLSAAFLMTEIGES